MYKLLQYTKHQYTKVQYNISQYNPIIMYSNTLHNQGNRAVGRPVTQYCGLSSTAIGQL